MSHNGGVPFPLKLIMRSLHVLRIMTIFILYDVQQLNKKHGLPDMLTISLISVGELFIQGGDKVFGFHYYI